MKKHAVRPVKPWELLAILAGISLILPGCQRTVTTNNGFTPAVIQRDGLVEMRAEGADKSLALIRREADVGSLRPEDIRPLISGENVRLPQFIAPGPGESRFGIGGNSRRPSMFFIARGLEWTPQQIHKVIVDGNAANCPITRVLVWKRKSSMGR